MMKPAKRVRLSRETLRSLDEGGRRPDGPVGTEPDSDIPNNTCFTLSCHHC
jgi:hypothetical protein